MSLSTSVGRLLAGLSAATCSSPIAPSADSGAALWIFNKVGLHGFIAVVGAMALGLAVARLISQPERLRE
jgi:hypothetical protein